LVFLPLLFSQFTLLAVWLSQTSRGNWIARLLTTAGVVYLFILTWCTTGPNDLGVVGAIGCGSFAVALLVMMALRFFNFRITRFSSDEFTPTSFRVQFSIRQLMVVTAIVAVLCFIFRNVSRHPDGMFVTVIAPWFAAPPLLATWATLTTGRLWLRIPIALGFS